MYNVLHKVNVKLSENKYRCGLEMYLIHEYYMEYQNLQ